MLRMTEWIPSEAFRRVPALFRHAEHELLVGLRRFDWVVVAESKRLHGRAFARLSPSHPPRNERRQRNMTYRVAESMYSIRDCART